MHFINFLELVNFLQGAVSQLAFVCDLLPDISHVHSQSLQGRLPLINALVQAIELLDLLSAHLFDLRQIGLDLGFILDERVIIILLDVFVLDLKIFLEVFQIKSYVDEDLADAWERAVLAFVVRLDM